MASGVPDLDMIAYLLGYRSPKYHRNATHSLLVMAAMVGVGWLLVGALPVTVEAGVGLAWVAAFFSHPFLDIVTTGPSTAARGYGIPLFWPVSRKRFHTAYPIMETLDIETCSTVREFWEGLRPEVYRLGGLSAGVLLLAVLV